MKRIVVTACLMSLTLLAGQAFAANAECEAKATEKKLSGAAKTSFVKKCETDASASPAAAASPACEKSAADKKLAGAAKNSHIRKCMADSTKG
ncbi:MAG: hypothetical protein H7Z19_18965 [Chitinophagaceae bacterium]|nr:hypothetical protein [Rubrivivax sp.]